jgi:eukaryotic-like serine/threonine-protein kinase
MSFDQYRLLAQLGAGPDGVAYRALAPDGETMVEVCDLSRARAVIRRWSELTSRVRLAQQIEHPVALRVLELGLDDEPAYVALEWVGTATLASTPNKWGTQNNLEVIALGRAIAGALAAAHRIGLSHGRLAPDQVLSLGGAQPKLDFTGVSAGFPALGARTGSPESGDGTTVAASRPADERASDLYQLGALFVWLLTGSRFQPGQRLDRPGLEESGVLGILTRKLLGNDPAERPSASEITRQLAAFGHPLEATGDWDGACQARASVLLPATLKAGGPADPAGTLVLDAQLPRVGRYHLLEKLGEGAQGVVFRAQDSGDGSVVAIKVLRAEKAENPDILRRFRKEARMMAEVNNPHVVNLLEYNEDGGIPYLVLEFVAGHSLGELLAQQGRLEEPQALTFMALVARGLMPAHERGIVHRDLKPSNILILRSSPAGPESLKVSDFGLARHVVDSESLAMTAAGALLGTPHYMAPEQWTGRAVDPRTDVYAMGATLFHLLAGRPPFEAETRDGLAGRHCNDPPPPLAKVNPKVSDGTVRLIERALAKRPEDRFADAGVLLRALEALLHGEPSDATLHPRLPVRDARRMLQFDFRWDLKSSARQLWPLVTDTDRLDRAIGFLPVRYTNRFEPGHGVRTFIEGRKAGTVEVGEQHPYEWVEPHRMGVVREYRRGPFVWLVSVVELLPRAGGGTTLIHRLQLEPRSWKIRVGSRFGVGVAFRKRLEMVYGRIDATLQAQTAGRPAREIDAFEEIPQLAGPKRARLEHVLNRLVERGCDATVVERLGEQLACGAPQEIARIRPLALAERFQLAPETVIAACLHGAREGLLELHWDLLCPLCRTSCHVTDTLRAIREHAHCEVCNLDFQLDFANSVELIFRAHPEIRQADLGTYCIGGPAHSPHVLAQIRVAPGERVELELELAEGSYRLRGPQLPHAIEFQISSAATVRRWEVALAVPGAERTPGSLRAGSQVLVLVNGHERELVARIERTVSRSDALTAARAASSALFRVLFPGEVLAPGQLAAVSTATFLVTALDSEQAEALYEGLGDAGAFGVLHDHFQRLGDAIREGGGAVVKTVGEGVLAAFSDVIAAVRTALELRYCLGGSEATRGLRLRVGVHRGTTLAATLNDHLDYFGATPREALAILPYARCNELVLTQTVAADPEVAAILQARGIEGEVVATGLACQPRLIRIGLHAPEVEAPQPRPAACR